MLFYLTVVATVMPGGRPAGRPDRRCFGDRLLVMSVGAGVALAALTGCTAGGHPTTARVAIRPAAAATPAARLAALAALAESASYRAGYALRTRHAGARPSSVTVYRTSSAYRVDVTTSGATAELISSHRGTVSCRVAPQRRACFRVAGPGQPLPALFDAGVQRIFTSYLSVLARSAGRYDVQPAGSTAASGRLPAGSCFSVRGGRPQEVAPGVYCLAPSGVVTRAAFASGSLVLHSLAGPPSPRQLRPPATPMPLPRARS